MANNNYNNHNIEINYVIKKVADYGLIKNCRLYRITRTITSNNNYGNYSRLFAHSIPCILLSIGISHNPCIYSILYMFVYNIIIII